MRIILAIATYNRIHYVERMSSSLLSSTNQIGNSVKVHVYDDCSTELNLSDLRKLFPYAESIVRREKNLRADGNMAKIFEDFLKTDGDILLLADSDLIYRPGWVDILQVLLPKTDGVLSLYNSRNHLPEGKIELIESWELCKKSHLGAAGTAFSRDRVKDIVEANMPHVNYDWKWSELFANKGIHLMCMHESYIQHIGVLGQNNFGSMASFDFGLHFYPTNRINEKIMATMLAELGEEQNRYEGRLNLTPIIASRQYDYQASQGIYGLSKKAKYRISLIHYFRIQLRRLLFQLLYRLS